MISGLDMVMWVSILLNLTLLSIIGWEKGWWLVSNSRSNVKRVHPPTPDSDSKKDAAAGCMERLVRPLPNYQPTTKQ